MHFIIDILNYISSFLDLKSLYIYKLTSKYIYYNTDRKYIYEEVEKRDHKKIINNYLVPYIYNNNNDDNSISFFNKEKSYHNVCNYPYFNFNKINPFVYDNISSSGYEGYITAYMEFRKLFYIKRSYSKLHIYYNNINLLITNYKIVYRRVFINDRLNINRIVDPVIDIIPINKYNNNKMKDKIYKYLKETKIKYNELNIWVAEI